MSEPATVRVQISRSSLSSPARIPEAVAVRAAEVYSHLFRNPNDVIHDRGGLHLSEVIAFLYARSFPQSEWQARVNEAFKGMEGF